MDRNDKGKPDISDLIARSLTGVITASERAELERWLNASPDNVRRFRELCGATDLVERYRLYASVDEKKAWRKFLNRNTRLWRRRFAVRLLRYAAVAVVLLAALIVYNRYVFDSGQPLDKDVQAAMRRSEDTGKQKAVLTFPNGEQTVLLSQTDMSKGSLVARIIRNITQTGNDKRNRLATYPDTEYWITLEDGTLVHLNGGTQFSYPAHFKSGERTVYLDGEAYFQVVHNADKPFRIITPHGEITDMGTSFNVNTHVDKGTEVVLVEGKVSVKTRHSGETVLCPGQLAYVGSRSNNVEVEKVDVSPFVSWNKGNFKFNDCPLEKLMNVISHWYGIKVKYESDDIRRICFTGDIDRYESARPVLKAIEEATGSLKIDNNGDEFVLRKK